MVSVLDFEKFKLFTANGKDTVKVNEKFKSYLQQMAKIQLK
jgi:hypothetical protein